MGEIVIKLGKNTQTKVLYGLLAILLVVGLVNLLLTVDLGSTLMKKKIELGITKAGEKPQVAAQPVPAAPKPKLQIFTIYNPDCEKCYKLAEISASLKQLEADFTTEKNLKLSDSEAQQLVAKYRLTKIPSLIIAGETDKVSDLKDNWEVLGTVESDGALVLRNTPPPYFDIAQGTVKGLVKMTSISHSSCEKCSATFTKEQLETAGVAIVEEKKLEYPGDDAEKLIADYGIKKLPTVILSEDIRTYDTLSKSFEQFGEFTRDGEFVVRNPDPVYFDLEKKKQYGFVNVIYLTKNDCAECYDVNAHNRILVQNFNAVFGSEKYVDVSSAEGKKLVKDYNVSFAPTLLLKGDLDAYSTLSKLWPSIGTIEKDGTYVFKKGDLLGNYFDFARNKLVKFDEEGNEIVEEKKPA